MVRLLTVLFFSSVTYNITFCYHVNNIVRFFCLSIFFYHSLMKCSCFEGGERKESLFFYWSDHLLVPSHCRLTGAVPKRTLMKLSEPHASSKPKRWTEQKCSLGSDSREPRNEQKTACCDAGDSSTPSALAASRSPRELWASVSFLIQVTGQLYSCHNVFCGVSNTGFC